MKKQLNIPLLLFALAISPLMAQQEIIIPLSDPSRPGKLKVTLHQGGITVTGSERKNILVRFLSEKEMAGKEELKNGLKKVNSGIGDIEIAENSNVVKIQSNTRVQVFVEVPASFDIDLRTYNQGDLIVRNVRGVVELTNYNGSIEAINISGAIVATTYNGDIKANLEQVTEGTPMAYSTYNGNIDITLPSTIKGTLKMKTGHGDIYTGFDLKLEKNGQPEKKEVRNNVYKLGSHEWVTASMNGGGAEITLKNYNGHIFVKKK